MVASASRFTAPVHIDVGGKIYTSSLDTLTRYLPLTYWLLDTLTRYLPLTYRLLDTLTRYLPLTYWLLDTLTRY